MAPRRVKHVWADGSLLQESGHAGAAFTFEQSPGRWSGKWFMIRRAGEDVRAVELRAIKEAARYLVDFARDTQATNGDQIAYIWTDCWDALREVLMFSSNGDPRWSTPWMTEVTHGDVIEEICTLFAEAQALNLHAEIRWNRRDSTKGNQVADHKAYLAAITSKRRAGSGLQTEGVVFTDESFQLAAARDD